MRYPKLREIKEALRSLFSRAYTSKFPYKAHVPFERFRGKPAFYEKDCTGCAACVQVCPTGALSFQDKMAGDKAKRVLTIRWDICISCGQCQANCLTSKGIMLTNEFDLATTENRLDLKQEIEKEMVLCEACGDMIVPLEQYKWVGSRLGPLVFSNSSLMLLYFRSLGLSIREKLFSKKESDFNRSDRIRILCPRCRREAVLKS